MNSILAFLELVKASVLLESVLCRAIYCMKSISIRKSMLVSVSVSQINDTFKDTFHNDINICTIGDYKTITAVG